MKRTSLICISLIIATMSAVANYTLYSFSGNITLTKGGRSITPEKGMKVGAADEIVIGPGATVEIYNSATKEIFRSVSEGKTSVMGIMLDARKQSGNSMDAINERWTMSKSDTAGNNRLYTEGLVKRSMHVYDPAAENREVDPHQLALHICSTMRDPGRFDAVVFPTEVSSEHYEGGGLNFSVANSLAFPIYMNVIKIQETSLNSVELSELGQPMSCYVILPGQSISREQLHGLDSSDSHILILTYCRFDIDRLIEEANSLLQTPADQLPDADLPLYLRRL